MGNCPSRRRLSSIALNTNKLWIEFFLSRDIAVPCCCVVTCKTKGCGHSNGNGWEFDKRLLAINNRRKAVFPFGELDIALDYGYCFWPLPRAAGNLVLACSWLALFPCWKLGEGEGKNYVLGCVSGYSYDSGWLNVRYWIWSAVVALDRVGGLDFNLWGFSGDQDTLASKNRILNCLLRIFQSWSQVKEPTFYAHSWSVNRKWPPEAQHQEDTLQMAITTNQPLAVTNFRPNEETILPLPLKKRWKLMNLDGVGNEGNVVEQEVILHRRTMVSFRGFYGRGDVRIFVDSSCSRTSWEASSIEKSGCLYSWLSGKDGFVCSKIQ